MGRANHGEQTVDRLWLVNYEGRRCVMADADFFEFADRVKYDGVEYEAVPLQTVGEFLDSRIENAESK